MILSQSITTRKKPTPTNTMRPFWKQQTTLRDALYYAVIASIILVFIGYAVFQARFLLTGPTVTFVDPPGTIQTQRQITLKGTAQNIVYISLNGRQIYTDKTGYFKEDLILENGYTIATVSVRDRYGRTRSYTQNFVYTPALTTR